MKRRVVHLINQLGLGGSERQLSLLLRHVDARRFETHVVVFNDSPHLVLNQTLESFGVRVWQVPDRCRGVRRRVLFLIRRFRALRPDVVHSWGIHGNAYAQVAGWLAGVPVRLGSVRGTLVDAGLQLSRLEERLCLDWMPAMVVNSRAAALELQQRGYEPRRIFHVPNGVELPPPRHDDGFPGGNLAAFGMDGSGPVIGTVGNLRRIKNHLMFVEAMARVLHRHPRTHAVIIGQQLPTEPDVNGRLKARIEELGLSDRVVLLGFRPDVLDLVSRLTIFCLTSRSEGTPNAILEAMAAGRPVVATRVGGVPDVVRHGKDGLLVESEDVAGLAEAVATLLADPDLAQRMGASGRRRVEASFSCVQAARSLEDAYDRLIETTGRKRGSGASPAHPAPASGSPVLRDDGRDQNEQQSDGRHHIPQQR